MYMYVCVCIYIYIYIYVYIGAVLVPLSLVDVTCGPVLRVRSAGFGGVVGRRVFGLVLI